MTILDLRNRFVTANRFMPLWFISSRQRESRVQNVPAKINFASRTVRGHVIKYSIVGHFVPATLIFPIFPQPQPPNIELFFLYPYSRLS